LRDRDKKDAIRYHANNTDAAFQASHGSIKQ